jgi:hypothetical protein
MIEEVSTRFSQTENPSLFLARGGRVFVLFVSLEMRSAIGPLLGAGRRVHTRTRSTTRRSR